MRLQAYFQAYRNYFWQWEDSTEIIAIPNGSTIAYKAFVLDVMEQIAPTGTPPFGALLFMLMATNPTAESDLEQIKENFSQQLDTKANQTGYHNQAFEFLAKVQNLPKAYKTGIKRVLLLQTIFKDSHNHLSAKKARQILREYQQQKDQFPHLILDQERSFSSDVLYKDFRVFQYLNEKFPNHKSILEALANLPILEEHTIEQATQGIESDLLLERLIEEPKTFLVAALIKYLWSGLNIPFQKLSPNEQPFGGFSSITNKGDFDRLLISEFAYDDWSFLSRLANDEALYLRQEVPPTANHLERIILIDVSLKNWGNPKIIAYAILLALAYHPKAKTTCKAYAIGGHLMSKQLQFDNLDSIIHSLEYLDASLDCSKGLDFFLNSTLLHKQSEIIYIGVQEATQSTTFRQVIHSYKQYFHYWIYPNFEGQIKVYQNKFKSQKHLQTIWLPLDRLWGNKETSPSKTYKIIDRHDCPILLPHPQPNENQEVFSTYSHDNIFIVTKRKDLLYSLVDKDSTVKKRGWTLLYNGLPFTSGIYRVGLIKKGVYMLLIFDYQTKIVSLINCLTKELKQAPFQEWSSTFPRQFGFHKGVFYYFARNECWKLDFYAENIITAISRPKDHFPLCNYNPGTLARLVKKWRSSSSLLKNIRAVELSINGNLLFNGKHELLLNSHGVIKLELSHNLKGQHQAKGYINKRIFAFKDGSRVQINSYGVILLISSDPNLPIIYVPMLPDAALGIGTENYFAGNEYYNCGASDTKIIKNQKFWETFIIPFVETIRSHL